MLFSFVHFEHPVVAGDTARGVLWRGNYMVSDSTHWSTRTQLQTWALTTHLQMGDFSQRGEHLVHQQQQTRLQLHAELVDARRKIMEDIHIRLQRPSLNRGRLYFSLTDALITNFLNCFSITVCFIVWQRDNCAPLLIPLDLSLSMCLMSCVQQTKWCKANAHSWSAQPAAPALIALL